MNMQVWMAESEPMSFSSQLCYPCILGGDDEKSTRLNKNDKEHIGSRKHQNPLPPCSLLWRAHRGTKWEH